MLTAISSLAGSAIGAQKEVKIAGIGLKQALELEKLKQGGAADAAGEAQALIAPDGIVDVSFTVLGYVKKIEVLTIKSRLYELNQLPIIDFDILVTDIWQPIRF